MAVNDLDFKGAYVPALGHADLRFGHAATTVPVAASGVLRVVLRSPTGTPKALRARWRARFDPAVLRPFAKSTGALWQPAVAQAVEETTAVKGQQSGWSSTAHLHRLDAEHWQHARAQAQHVTALLQQLQVRRDTRDVAWTLAQTAASVARDDFDSLRQTRLAEEMDWLRALPLYTVTRDGFVWLLPLPRVMQLPWQVAHPLGGRQGFEFAHATAHRKAAAMPWQRGRRPPAGMSVPPVIVPPSSGGIHRSPPIDLAFWCRLPADASMWRAPWWLHFGVPCGGGGQPGDGIPPGEGGLFSVPILKVYFMQHSLSFVRLPERIDIPVKSLSISIDRDSWAWGLNASLPGSALSLVEPTGAGSSFTPVEVEVVIDGASWVFLVEEIELRQEFGSSTVNLRGRSRAAWLAEPYAPRRSFAPNAPITTRQLAEAELSRAGLETGFGLDWRLTDWLLPAGAVSFEQTTPMAVINHIVESAGGFVNAHPFEQRLIAASRLPRTASGDLLSPWQWQSSEATAVLAATLPQAALRTLAIRRLDKPAFDAVYVSGERVGVTAFVKRSGSAGDAQASMVVDPFITHADAARARGTTVLAESGAQANVSVELPFYTGMQALLPGRLIEVGSSGASNPAWRGVIQSFNLAAQWNDALSVRQGLEIVRYLGN